MFSVGRDMTRFVSAGERLRSVYEIGHVEPLEVGTPLKLRISAVAIRCNGEFPVLETTSRLRMQCAGICLIGIFKLATDQAVN